MDFFSSSSFTKSIDGLELHFNTDGWGPVNGEKVSTFDEVPYAHFDKKDKCYRVADFSQNSYNQQYPRPYQRYNRRDEMGNGEFSYKHDAVEDSTFQLVDTSKTQAKSMFFIKSTCRCWMSYLVCLSICIGDPLQFQAIVESKITQRSFSKYSISKATITPFCSDEKIWSTRSRWKRRSRFRPWYAGW